MSWYYQNGTDSAGPIPLEELHQLRKSGKITPTTLVWSSSFENWKTYESAFSSAPADAAPLQVLEESRFCAECNRAFPASEMISLNNTYICAECKPVYVQKLREGVPAGSTGAWRESNKMVVKSGTHLPDRCTKCNTSAELKRIQRKLVWSPSWVYLLIIINLLICLIVALCIQKKAQVNLSLCRKHRRQRGWGILIAWLGSLGGLFLIFYGGLNSSTLSIVLGILAFLGAIVFGLTWGRTFVVTRIQDGFVWIKGIHADYLAQLPNWGG